MGKLSNAVKDTIAEIRPAIIATVGKDGRPNVSAKGSFRVLDDDHVVFADIASPRTIANLRENPQAAVLVLNVKSMTGCRIWGRAEILESGEVFDGLSKEYAPRNMKVNHAVRITVDEVQESP